MPKWSFEKILKQHCSFSTLNIVCPADLDNDVFPQKLDFHSSRPTTSLEPPPYYGTFKLKI